MKINFFWFRRDLRLEDNAGLYYALTSMNPVQCLFIFDTEILDKLENKNDSRVVFIHRQLDKLNTDLKKNGASLLVKYGTSLEVWKNLCEEYEIDEVYTNHDYEPYAKHRDQMVSKILQEKNIALKTFKDQVIFEKDEVTKSDGTPYTVFTPYMKRWRMHLDETSFKSYETEKYFHRFYQNTNNTVMPLSEIGFNDSQITFPKSEIENDILHNYSHNRDIPSLNGTSRISVHLRFGTVSIRKLMQKALQSEKWMNELIWREFYMMILWHFPKVVNAAFKDSYNHIQWLHDEDGFKKWCEGKTGYPIVDAGMRELNATGFMHNRVRMITAMFLTKYLLIDWKWGEAYFAERLLDFELSSNNGGWQWSAGTGVDAAPYFRIFSMEEQTKRFDPNFIYIKKWVPEFEDLTYPKPIVDYKFARERCLQFYKKALSTKN